MAKKDGDESGQVELEKSCSRTQRRKEKSENCNKLFIIDELNLSMQIKNVFQIKGSGRKTKKESREKARKPEK